MNQVDLSAGVIVSSNPYMNFLRKAVEAQIEALNASPEEAQRLEQMHPMMLTLELLGLSGSVANQQLSSHDGLRLWSKPITHDTPIDVVKPYAWAVRTTLLGLLATTPPESELEAVANQLQQRASQGVTPDPGGAAAFIVDALYATVTPSPLMYLQALMSLLMSAAYAGVELDELLAELLATLPQRSLLVTL